MKKVEDISDRIKEIENFAKENDNKISLFVVQDIIKNKLTGVDEDLLNQVIYLLRERGITILPVDADEGYKADEEEPDKFIPSDVTITQTPTNISNIMDRLENNEYDLTPAFQRNSDLWNEEKQSQLIESLMLKIPLPAFYCLQRGKMGGYRWLTASDSVPKLSCRKYSTGWLKRQV